MAPAQVVQLDQLPVQVFLIETFQGDDHIGPILIMAQVQPGIVAGDPYEPVVHKFHTGGVQPLPEQHRDDAGGFGLVRKDGQYIGLKKSLGQQLQGHFSNDSQGAFTANHQLIQAIPGGILFAPGP